MVPHPVMDNYVSAFHNARSLTRRVVEDADHAFSQKPAQKAYTAILIKWLAEMIMGAREEARRRCACASAAGPSGHAHSVLPSARGPPITGRMMPLT